MVASAIQQDDLFSPLTFSIFFTISFIGSVDMMMWKLEVNGDEITWHSTLGRKKVFHFEDITQCERKKGSIRVYVKGQKLFTIDSNIDKEEFEHGVFKTKCIMKAKDTKGSITIMQNEISNQSTEYIIRPYLYMPVAVSIATIFMAGLALYSIFHDEYWICTALFSVMPIILFVQTLRLCISKTVLRECDVIQYAFLKKRIQIKYKDISSIKIIETPKATDKSETIVIETNVSNREIKILNYNKGYEKGKKLLYVYYKKAQDNH